jgi:hypothetical protein
MRKLLALAAFAAFLAIPALAQAPEPQIPTVLQIPAPVPAQTLPPCSQACCYGEFNAATECSYYSPSYGYRPYSQCYWWWSEGGSCEG